MKINPKAKLIRNLFGKNTPRAAIRDGYGEGLLALGKANEKVVVLSADLTESTRSQAFAQAYPERFVEVGVAEQNLAGLATGMALSGYVPFMSSFAVFSPGRNWDQIRVSICYTNANVKIAGSHAGVSVGEDGATHQALEDIAITRVLPNMTVVVPSDAIEARKATAALGEMSGPGYIRLSRPATPVSTTEKSPFKIGRAEVLADGKDAVIVACGLMVHPALEAAFELKKKHKLSAAVINSHTIKPLDERTIVRYAQKTGAVVTAEEHQVHGGLGGAVAEALAFHHPTAMRFVGMPDSFGESGKAEELLQKYGMSVEKIVSSVLGVVKDKVKK
ncbi:MAG: transketolase family protein [Parcubacteria group bacterium]|nr:transketolase family protein [Parcubacteria group bacterium]